jgi:hypothetical protein
MFTITPPMLTITPPMLTITPPMLTITPLMLLGVSGVSPNKNTTYFLLKNFFFIKNEKKKTYNDNFILSV